MSFLSKLVPKGILSTATTADNSRSVPWRYKNDSQLHRKLQHVMRLYNFLTDEQQRVIREFVSRFYHGKEVFVHPSLSEVEEPLLAIAANAALVGAAQKTHAFSTVKWIYLCADDLDVDGDAFASSTVRVYSDICVEESKYPEPGRNLVVHEFSHILDAQFGLASSTAGLNDGFRKYIHDLQNGNWIPMEDCFTDIDSIDLSLDETQYSAFHTDIEFFATASEAFFTNAHELREYHQQLYKDLSSIYGLDLAELNWNDIWKA